MNSVYSEITSDMSGGVSQGDVAANTKLKNKMMWNKRIKNYVINFSWLMLAQWIKKNVIKHSLYIVSRPSPNNTRQKCGK